MFGGISKELAKQKDDEIERLKDTVNSYKEYLTTICGYEMINDTVNLSLVSDGYMDIFKYSEFEEKYSHLGLHPAVTIGGTEYDTMNSRYNVAKIENEELKLEAKNNTLKQELSQFYLSVFLDEIDQRRKNNTKEKINKKTKYTYQVWSDVAKKLGVDGIVAFYDVCNGLYYFRLNGTQPEKDQLLKDYEVFLRDHKSCKTKHCKLLGPKVKDWAKADEECFRLRKMFTYPE